MPSPTPIEDFQAQSFISAIFDIVAKSLENAMSNNKPNLLKEAGVAIEENQSVDKLFEKLASEINGDSATVTMIRNNGNNYQERISQALKATCPELKERDIDKGSRLERKLSEEQF